MRISYQWTEQEWEEAVRLADRTSVRRPGLPGMTYALVGIPLVGAVLDLRSTVRSNKGITLAGSILPMLLVLVAITATVLIAVISLSRKRKRNRVADMPSGEWELVLKEAGWRCTGQESTGPTADVAVPENALAEAPAAATATLPRPATVEAIAAMDSGHTPAPGSNGQLTSTTQKPLRPWSDLVETRQGNRVLVFILREGFAAVPTRSLTPEQGGHMHRMVVRKLKPNT